MSIGEIAGWISGTLTLTATVITLFLKLQSTAKMRRFAETINILTRKTHVYMEMAEQELKGQSGQEKKAWVIKRVKDFASTLGYTINGHCHGYWIDTAMVSEWIEFAISFSHKVNAHRAKKKVEE